MKLAVKMGGMCGSAAFIITALPGLYQQILPFDISQMSVEALPSMAILETLMISFGGALGVGIMGYIIGDILSNPRGGKKRLKNTPPLPQAIMPAPAVEPASPLLTTQEPVLPAEMEITPSADFIAPKIPIEET